MLLGIMSLTAVWILTLVFISLCRIMNLQMMKMKKENRFLHKSQRDVPQSSPNKVRASKQKQVTFDFVFVFDRKWISIKSCVPDRYIYSAIYHSTNNMGCALPECRREKSLGLLSQKFVQLFLVSQTQVVTLEDAARLLLGDCKDASKLKSTFQTQCRDTNLQLQMAVHFYVWYSITDTLVISCDTFCNGS